MREGCLKVFADLEQNLATQGTAEKDRKNSGFTSNLQMLCRIVKTSGGFIWNHLETERILKILTVFLDYIQTLSRDEFFFNLLISYYTVVNSFTGSDICKAVNNSYEFNEIVARNVLFIYNELQSNLKHQYLMPVFGIAASFTDFVDAKFFANYSKMRFEKYMLFLCGRASVEFVWIFFTCFDDKNIEKSLENSVSEDILNLAKIFNWSFDSVLINEDLNLIFKLKESFIQFGNTALKMMYNIQSISPLRRFPLFSAVAIILGPLIADDDKFSEERINEQFIDCLESNL